MALFRGNKPNPLQRLRASEWSDTPERNALLSEVVRLSPKPAEFIFLLSHKDSACRQAGMSLAQKQVGPELIAALLDEAEQKPEAVRKAILKVITGLPGKELVPALEKLTSQKSTPAREKLAWQIAFELPSDDRLRFLELGVHSKNAWVRNAAVQHWLKQTPGAGEPPAMFFELARADDGAVRSQVLAHLTQWSAESVLELMNERLVNDELPENRERALAYLAERARKDPQASAKRMIPLLASSSEHARKGAIQMLLNAMPPEQSLLAILEHSRGLAGWMRGRILDALRDHKQITQPLAGLLSHADAEIRTQALVLAQDLADPQLAGPVARLLHDPDWWIRVMAADCLGRLKNESVVDELIMALQDGETKWAALEALARIGTPRALQGVIHQLGDPQAEVRLEAIAALSSFHDPRVTAMIEHVAEKDTSSAVRTRAAEILRSMGKVSGQESNFGESATAARHSIDLHLPFDRLLTVSREQGASDVHIAVGEPPWARIGGNLVKLEGHEVVDKEQAQEWLLPILDVRQSKLFHADGEVDVCYAIEEVGRYRANIFDERNGVSGSFRVISNIPPSLADLGAPPGLSELLDHHQGLIIVSGPTGSGKSTTLAAFVNLINETKPVNIITLEDPVELVHPPKIALVEQREIGRHTESFARGLRAALREDPDVIVVGEIRDAETTRLALTAAETGHLVFATLHTTSAIQTVDRLVDAFPPDEQPQVRMALSETLKCVIAQSLVPSADGRGRVAVFEILKCTSSAANVIREGKTFQLVNLMQIGQSVGMRTVDQSLLELVQAQRIAPATAFARAERKESFEALVREEASS